MTKQKERLYNLAAIIGTIWCIASYAEIIVRQGNATSLSNANVFVVLFRLINNIL